MDSLNLDSQFLIDCTSCFFKANKSEMLICLGTIIVGAVIRHFEKKRIEKNKTK
jgi:hypothetical protein